MGHLTMAAGAACVALMISSSAFAQVQPTPNPNNPNDAIPEASNLPPYGDPINIETAKKVAAAAVAESKKRNWNTMCVAVVDPHKYLTTLDDVIASRGGNPIIVNGKVIGAIGASGGTGSQDNVVSQAGIADFSVTTGSAR